GDLALLLQLDLPLVDVELTRPVGGHAISEAFFPGGQVVVLVGGRRWRTRLCIVCAVGAARQGRGGCQQDGWGASPPLPVKYNGREGFGPAGRGGCRGDDQAAISWRWVLPGAVLRFRRCLGPAAAGCRASGG